jgi:hypothetical protein
MVAGHGPVGIPSQSPWSGPDAWHPEQIIDRVRASGAARRAVTMAAVQVWGQWEGFQSSASGFVPLTMAACRGQETHAVHALPWQRC